MKILNEKPILWSEAKKILEENPERKLGYEQKNALEHLRKFSKLSGKNAEEMFEKLGELTKLKDRHKVNIINFLPQDLDELRILFANEIINLSEDEKKKILAIVKKYS